MWRPALTNKQSRTSSDSYLNVEVVDETCPSTCSKTTLWHGESEPALPKLMLLQLPQVTVQGRSGYQLRYHCRPTCCAGILEFARLGHRACLQRSVLEERVELVLTNLTHCRPSSAAVGHGVLIVSSPAATGDWRRVKVLATGIIWLRECA